MHPISHADAEPYERSGRVLDSLIKAVTSANEAGDLLVRAREEMQPDEHADLAEVDALLGALRILQHSLNAEWRRWVEIADERSREF